MRNVFGDELSISPARKPDPDPLLRWELFTLSPLPDTNNPGDPDLPGVADEQSNPVLFIPPTSGFREESPSIEEIRFLRDEGANMVWAVEHTVQNGLGRSIDGFDAQRERKEGQGEKPKPGGSEVPCYRLATTVPANWIPFIPAVFFDQGRRVIRLRRAQMLRSIKDDAPGAIKAMSHLLELAEDPLLLLEEATVPRSGLRMQLTAQRMRWMDGRTYVWLGRKVMAGRGEGSSGLRFDMMT